MSSFRARGLRRLTPDMVAHLSKDFWEAETQASDLTPVALGTHTIAEEEDENDEDEERDMSTEGSSTDTVPEKEASQEKREPSEAPVSHSATRRRRATFPELVERPTGGVASGGVPWTLSSLCLQELEAESKDFPALHPMIQQQLLKQFFEAPQKVHPFIKQRLLQSVAKSVATVEVHPMIRKALLKLQVNHTQSKQDVEAKSVHPMIKKALHKLRTEQGQASTVPNETQCLDNAPRPDA